MPILQGRSNVMDAWYDPRTHCFPTFQGIDISPHLSLKQDSQNTLFFQWRTLEDFLDSTFDLLQQDYLANPVPERWIIVKRRRRDTMVEAKEEDKWIGMTSMDLGQDNYLFATRIISSYARIKYEKWNDMDFNCIVNWIQCIPCGLFPFSSTRFLCWSSKPFVSVRRMSVPLQVVSFPWVH